MNIEAITFTNIKIQTILTRYIQLYPYNHFHMVLQKALIMHKTYQTNVTTR